MKCGDSHRPGRCPATCRRGPSNRVPPNHKMWPRRRSRSRSGVTRVELASETVRVRQGGRRPCDAAHMITSIHALIYSDDVDATRTFLRDVLGFPYVNDVGTSDGSSTGWLIFG